MLPRLIDIFELNEITIKMIETSAGYDVIFQTVNMNGVFLKNVELSEAYAFISGYMYRRVKLMERACNYENN